MIEIKDLSFGYSSGHLLFSGLSLELGGGMVCGLLGKNGVGKSTLLHLVAGLLCPLSGGVAYRGIRTFDRVPGVLADMFLVPEVYELPAIKLRDWLRAVAPFYPRFSRERMMSCLDMFEVERDCNLGSLSMGQRKKAFLSFALSSGVTTLLMDEPTNGLDIPSKGQFRRALAQFMDGESCILISTHQVADVENLLDHSMTTRCCSTTASLPCHAGCRLSSAPRCRPMLSTPSRRSAVWRRWSPLTGNMRPRSILSFCSMLRCRRRLCATF